MVSEKENDNNCISGYSRKQLMSGGKSSETRVSDPDHLDGSGSEHFGQNRRDQAQLLDQI